MSPPLPEERGIKVCGSFLPGKSQQEVEEFFHQNRKRKISKIFGEEEEIRAIDEKAKPLGSFIFKQRKGEEIHKKRIFVDLSSAEIYSIQGVEIKRNPTLKKILELPSALQENLFHLIQHKAFDYEDFPKKHLSILEKKDLVRITGRGEKSFLISLSDHLLDTLRVFTDFLGETLHMGPTQSSSSESEVTKRVIVNFKPLQLDRQYDLDFYLESEEKRRVSKEFAPEEINYSHEGIKKILKKISSEKGEVTFEGVAYLPYYDCCYANEKERHLLYFPLKFKSFTTHLTHLEYRDLYNFIDKAPELPFLFLASLYVAYIYPNLDKIFFIFSNSFIFVLLALLIGFSLKLTFKKERAVPYLTSSWMRYGFPSLHSLTSIGAISFVYFIPELGSYLSLVLIPLGFLYVYSRLKLKVHSLRDVIGGGIIGLLLGFLCGYFLLSLKVLSLPHIFQLVLTFLFFIFPIFSILYRIKAGYLP